MNESKAFTPQLIAFNFLDVIVISDWIGNLSLFYEERFPVKLGMTKHYCHLQLDWRSFFVTQS